jgi:hypothetical protein
MDSTEIMKKQSIITDNMWHSTNIGINDVTMLDVDQDRVVWLPLVQ